MSGAGLHVIFGTGQVGRELARTLSARSLPVRTVSRHHPQGLPEVSSGVEWHRADATDPAAATKAAEGAAVLYQCLNAPYTRWHTLFPALQRGVLTAAESTGALLVSLENLYGYGPTTDQPMTEDLPLTATTTKGATRAAMTHELLTAAHSGRVRIAIGRASDFFGPGVTQSTLGEQIFAKALAGKRADFLGNPDLLHSYSYVPDIATGLATLGTDERAAGQVWHLPGPETVTTRQIIDIVSTQLGHPVSLRTVPRLAIRTIGLVNPMIRAMAEMEYEFTAPFVLDTTKYSTTFAHTGTPLRTAVADTLQWYRERPPSTRGRTTRPGHDHGQTSRNGAGLTHGR